VRERRQIVIAQLEALISIDRAQSPTLAVREMLIGRTSDA
jgi:hypothetical protein